MKGQNKFAVPHMCSTVLPLHPVKKKIAKEPTDCSRLHLEVVARGGRGPVQVGGLKKIVRYAHTQ